MTSIKERVICFANSMSISQREFEKRCNLAAGFISHIANSIAPASVRKIKAAFPTLNIDWLQTGEGEMLLRDEQPSEVVASGDSSTAVKGNNNQVNSASFVSVMNRAFDEIAAQRTLTQKRDEQIDRLLTMLELKIK